MEHKLLLKFKYIIRIFSSIACGLIYVVRSIRILKKIRQREGDTHQSYKHIAPVYAIAIVDSNYFSDDLAFHSFSMREDTTGEVLTITNNGQENHLVKMAFLELKIQRNQQRLGSQTVVGVFSGINPLPNNPSEPSARQTNC